VSPDGRFVAFLTKRFADIECGGQLSGCWFDPLDEPLCPESYVAVWHLSEACLTACNIEVPANVGALEAVSTCALCRLPPSEDDVGHLRVACARDGCTVRLTADICQAQNLHASKFCLRGYHT
jgi:hypothetical protein